MTDRKLVQIRTASITFAYTPDDMRLHRAVTPYGAGQFNSSCDQVVRALPDGLTRNSSELTRCRECFPDPPPGYSPKAP